MLKRLERGADGLDTAKAKAETQSSMKTDTKEGPKEATKRQRKKKKVILYHKYVSRQLY